VARTVVRTRNSVIAGIAVRRGDADAMICGVEGRFPRHVEHIRQIIGLAPEAVDFAAMSLLILAKGTYFLCDTYVNKEHSVDDLVEMTLMAAAAVRRFGIEPKVALVSHANFGSSTSETAKRMRAAVARLHAEHPELEVDGEMHADSAIDEATRQRALPSSRLKGSANLLIMPTLDAANISFNLLKVLGDGLPVGPIMLGTAMPAHVLTASVTARGVLNMTAVACVDAQERAKAAAD
jgi:malate dehydrogenase (oxaloacetate-decarboxylating)(NADP+)